MYRILENHSPYYIKFDFDGIDSFLSEARRKLEKMDMNGLNSVFQRKLSTEDGKELLALLPFGSQFEFQEDRVAFIITKPGTRHFVHIDGAPISFNFGIKISDFKCKTNWYNPQDIMDNYTVADGLPNNKFVVNEKEFLEKPATPVEVLTQKENECILFNSSLFHDFNNSNSTNSRIILTLRMVAWNQKSFEEVKKILFNL